MNKKIVAIAIAAVLAAPMALQAAPTVYGKMHLSLESDNNLEDGKWSMENNNSNLGVKGSEDLGNGLSAVYKIEFGLGGATGGAIGGADATVTARNTYVGLAGSFGTALMGRHDTPYKIAADNLDPFANTTADQSRMYNGFAVAGAGSSERRLNDVVAYISPSFSGLTLAGAVALAEVPAADHDGNDLTDIISLAAMYSNGPIYVGLGYETISDDLLPETETLTRLGASYDLGTIKLGLVYGMAQNIAGLDEADSATISAYGTFTFGNTALKLALAQETTEDAVADDVENTAITVGVDHSLSKATKVYAIYDSYDNDDDAGDADYNTIALGIQHNF